jgi:hypothetical protein
MAKDSQQKWNRRKVLSTATGGIASLGIFTGSVSASEVTEFDPYDPNEVINYVEYLENYPKSYRQKLYQLDDEQREAVLDAYTVSYIITDPSYRNQEDPVEYDVNVVNRNVGKKWDWGPRPKGLVKAREKQGKLSNGNNRNNGSGTFVGDAETSTTEIGGASTQSSGGTDTVSTAATSTQTYTDNVRARSYLGFTVYKWFHRVKWEYDGTRVSNVRPETFTKNVSVVWNYDGLTRKSLTFDSSQRKYTSFRQGRFIGPGIDNTRFTTNPLIEIEGNRFGAAQTTLKQTY